MPNYNNLIPDFRRPDQEEPKPPKSKKPIVTHNPNDPRIKKYTDSLDLWYNNKWDDKKMAQTVLAQTNTINSQPKRVQDVTKRENRYDEIVKGISPTTRHTFTDQETGRKVIAHKYKPPEQPVIYEPAAGIPDKPKRSAQPISRPKVTPITKSASEGISTKDFSSMLKSAGDDFQAPVPKIYGYDRFTNSYLAQGKPVDRSNPNYANDLIVGWLKDPATLPVQRSNKNERYAADGMLSGMTEGVDYQIIKK